MSDLDAYTKILQEESVRQSKLRTMKLDTAMRL